MHYSGDMYIPCSISLENPQQSQDSPIKAIHDQQNRTSQVNQVVSDNEYYDYIKLKPKTKAIFQGSLRERKKQNYLIRRQFYLQSDLSQQHSSENDTERKQQSMNSGKIGQQKDEIYSMQEEEFTCIQECLRISTQNEILRGKIQQIQLLIQTQCKEGDSLVKAISTSISGISHWQKGYFDCSKVNVQLDEKVQKLTNSIKNQEYRRQKLKNQNKEKKNNEDLLKILENIETMKSVDQLQLSENKRLSIQSKQNSLQNSMKVSMISSSGKKYTKVTPIADWQGNIAKRRNTEKGQKRKIFVNKQGSTLSKKIKNNSQNIVNEKSKEGYRSNQTTVIDIPKLFQKSKTSLFQQVIGMEEGQKKLKKMRTINNYSLKKENENNINIGNIMQCKEKPLSVNPTLQGKKKGNKVCVRLSLCKR